MSGRNGQSDIVLCHVGAEGGLKAEQKKLQLYTGVENAMDLHLLMKPVTLTIALV